MLRALLLCFTATATLGFAPQLGPRGLVSARPRFSPAAAPPIAARTSPPAARLSPIVLSAAAEASEEAPKSGSALAKVDVPLLSYFSFWYLGNYFYNIANKRCLKAAGGVTGYPMTIGVLQLGVGMLYALFLWAAPDARETPNVTWDDIVKTLPVGFCSMMAHCASVFALSAGAVSFGQIVKAGEPAFAALVSTTFYGNVLSKNKWLCLIPVIGGVVIASVSELSFTWAALISACLANLFAAFKANENKKLMETTGLKERIGTVGNQYALTTIISFVLGIPLLILKEGSKWGSFVELLKTNKAVSGGLISSGLYFYLYNELATLTIKKTSAVTQSVANTAKRVIVIIGVALVLGESLAPIKLLGCAVTIGGVFLYSLVK